MDLTNLIALCTAYHIDKSHNMVNLPGLSVFYSEKKTDIEAFVYEPVICLILQGSKTTSIGDHLVDLRPGDALLVSHDLPVMSRIIEASPKEPYMALILSIDTGLVRTLHGQVAETQIATQNARPLSAGPADPAWMAPLVRYLQLAHSPQDAKVLGPSVLHEIHYRLLLSPLGGMLRNLLIADSHASRIAKAISRLRAHFRTRISVAELAGLANMSTSSFHEHFKAVTGASPLQYQKELRLIEARRLLAEHGQSVTEVAYMVGYESPTHFSRDYARKFGLPPSKDTRALAYESEVLLTESA